MSTKPSVWSSHLTNENIYHDHNRVDDRSSGNDDGDDITKETKNEPNNRATTHYNRNHSDTLLSSIWRRRFGRQSSTGSWLGQQKSADSTWTFQFVVVTITKQFYLLCYAECRYLVSHISVTNNNN